MKSGRLRTFLPKNFKATLLVCSTGKFPTFTVLIRAGIILAQFCLTKYCRRRYLSGTITV